MQGLLKAWRILLISAFERHPLALASFIGTMVRPLLVSKWPNPRTGGRKEVWIDVLEDPGQRLAYMRSRASSDLRDIVLYERDEHGVVRRELEVDYVPWPYSLADIPAKFHSEFQGKAPTVTEYTYEENFITDSQLQIKKRGSDIEVSEEKDCDVRQIISGSIVTDAVPKSHFDRVDKVKHYFPSERDALVTVIVSKGATPVEVYVDFSKNYRNAIAGVSAHTAPRPPS